MPVQRVAHYLLQDLTNLSAGGLTDDTANKLWLMLKAYAAIRCNKTLNDKGLHKPAAVDAGADRGNQLQRCDGEGLAEGGRRKL